MSAGARPRRIGPAELRALPRLALVVVAGWAAPAAATALPPLHAVHGAAPRILDAAGRQVLLRGVDEDALGEYYQQYPARPPVLPLTGNDFREMAGLGFNVVRLVLSWSRLEPARGAFDLAYVRQIRRAVGWAAANGIYVVLDMHQDAWGIGTRGAPDATCPPGSSPPVGYDGAPQWATLTGGLPACAVDGIREISPANENAWQHFYDNASGIQSELIATWGRLAAQFAADPTVAGYDLLNEPNPGLGFSEANDQLGNFYAGALVAIRAGERRVPGGYPHIAFFEPGVEWSALGTTATPAWPFTAQPNVVFAPHLYGGSIAYVSVDQGFTDAATAATQYDSTIWSGEYGWYGDPRSDRANIADFARQQDAHLWGGAWWQWKQACGSPSTVGAYGQAIPPVTNSLVRIDCRTAAGTGAELPSVRAMRIPPSTAALVSRATVHIAPGRLTALSSDPSTGAFSVRGQAAPGSGGPSCRLEVWVPGSGRPRLAGAGARRLAARRVRGGYLVSGCAQGSYALRLIGRSRPGLACGPALVLGAGRRSRSSVVVHLRESPRAESPCSGAIARHRFTLAPGGSAHWTLRFGSRRLGLVATGTDADANPFRRRFSLRSN